MQIWTIQKSYGSYPPLSRIKVIFFPFFFFFFFDFFFFFFFIFYICDLFSFLHLWPKVFYICDCIFFFTFVTFFTYDVEFLHLAFLVFTYVAVVTLWPFLHLRFLKRFLNSCESSRCMHSVFRLTGVSVPDGPALRPSPRTPILLLLLAAVAV